MSPFSSCLVFTVSESDARVYGGLFAFTCLEAGTIQVDLIVGKQLLLVRVITDYDEVVAKLDAEVHVEVVVVERVDRV